jgi:hypothetical protein
LHAFQETCHFLDLPLQALQALRLLLLSASLICGHMLSQVPGCLSRRYHRSLGRWSQKIYPSSFPVCTEDAGHCQIRVRPQHSLSNCSDFAGADRYLTHVPTNTNFWSLISLATHHWRSAVHKHSILGAKVRAPLHSPLYSLPLICLVGNQREPRTSVLQVLYRPR